MNRVVLVTAVALLLLAAPAPAGVGSFKHSASKLADCDEELRSATFQGTMSTFGKARSLQMRFTLQARDAVNQDWTRIEADTFDEWLTATPGIPRYVYDKQIKDLSPGTSYRAVIRYRWRSGAGAIVARAIRRTPACDQPDDRANLKAQRVKVSAGRSADSRSYTVRVVNYGNTATGASVVALQVNGATGGNQFQPGLVEGDEDDITFEAPVCAPGSQLVASVDATMLVEESDESDNTLTVECPVTRSGTT